MRNRFTVPVILRVLKKGTGPDMQITVPAAVYTRLDIHCPVMVKVGMEEADVTCCSNSMENIVEISEDLADSLGFFDELQVNLTVKKNKLCLGPVIGVFVSNKTIRKTVDQDPSFRLIELTWANQEAKTILYYFSVYDVDFLSHRISGTYYNEVDGLWEQKYFPFPDILYDRGGGSLKKQKAISKYIREQLMLYSDLRKINSRYYFDKWDLYKQLAKHKGMLPHLPYTTLYRGEEDLVEMFRRTSAVYIKTRFGSRGRGIARALKLPDGNYHLSYYHNGVVEYLVSSIGDLVNKIYEVYSNRKMILQCAIDVIQLEQRNVDMRANVQRNGKGELEVFAYPVRLGKENCPITSTKSGSTVYTLEDFFLNMYGYSTEQIQSLKEKINNLLFKSYRYVEEVYGIFGELGIDFAMDKQGKLWFIECNAKPGKDSLFTAYDRETVKRAFLNPLEYAKFLCGF